MNGEALIQTKHNFTTGEPWRRHTIHMSTPVSSASPRTGAGQATGRGRGYPHTGARQGGLKKGEDPQAGPGSVNHSPPLHIYGLKQ